MNKYRFAIFVKEFPFLRELLGRSDSEHFNNESKYTSKDNTVNSLRKRHEYKFGFDYTCDEGVRGYINCTWLHIPDAVKIKKADKNLLSCTPISDSYSWSCGGYHNFTHYYAIVGEEIFQLDTESTWSDGSGGQGSSSANPVGEQLLEKGLKADFIVCVEFEDTDANGNGETSECLTIYKMHGFDLKSYHQEQFRKIVAELEAEIEYAFGEEEMKNDK
ncbi:MAG: hypothetical protein WCV41_02630 [Patescibacteria group bacterium]